MLKRIIGVLTLKPAIYLEIAEDTTATKEAAILVALSLLIQGFFAGFIEVDEQTGIVRSNWTRGLGEAVAVIISGLIAWVIAAWVLAFVAKLLRGKTNTGEMLRVTGYVEVFGIIAILSLLALAIPSLAIVTEITVFTIAILWFIGCVIGVGEAADLSTRKAFIAAIVAGIINTLIAILFADLIIRALGIAGS